MFFRTWHALQYSSGQSRTHSWARICKPFKEPRHRSQPSGPVRQPYLSYRPARLHRSLSESIPGLHKRSQIRALVFRIYGWQSWPPSSASSSSCCSCLSSPARIQRHLTEKSGSWVRDRGEREKERRSGRLRRTKETILFLSGMNNKFTINVNLFFSTELIFEKNFFAKINVDKQNFFKI